MAHSTKRFFAFIVHSRNRTDITRKFKFLRFLPNTILDFLTFNLPPFVVSKITGVKDVEGIVVGIPMTAHQMLENRTVCLKRITQAVKLSKKKGVKYIGLGAMTASLSKGGKDIIDNFRELFVTTGKTYTVVNILSYTEYFAQRLNFVKESITIGIVGAAGGIGSGVALELARKGFKKFILVDLERKLSTVSNNMEKVANDYGLDIKVDHHVGLVSQCDIIVAATSAPEVIIMSKDVSPGTLIINDAQPSDIDPEIVKNRKDVLVIEGGVLHTSNIDCHFNFGLAHKNDIFSCLAETILLASIDDESHYSINGFDLSLLDKLKYKALEFDFNICPQNDAGILSNDTINNFYEAVKSRVNL